MTRELDVLKRCQRALPAWRGLQAEEFEFSPPRGFSSFTMGVRCARDVEPRAVLYRHLADKPNTLLGYATEREVYLTLARDGVAADVLAYEGDHRIEAYYEGRSLTRDDLADHEILRGIGRRLAHLHSLSPSVPDRPFFELIGERWVRPARRVLVDERHRFPPGEQQMCVELLGLLEPDVMRRVRARMPDGPLNFCHNDTYHGNVMLLDGGEVRLVDFEFSCLNHPAFDFANLFAETAMRHKLEEYPHFALAEPTFSEGDVMALVQAYLDAAEKPRRSAAQLFEATLQSIALSDFMYALAATTLAAAPIQKIRFIPYAHARFQRFLDTTSL